MKLIEGLKKFDNEEMMIRQTKYEFLEKMGLGDWIVSYTFPWATFWRVRDNENATKSDYATFFMQNGKFETESPGIYKEDCEMLLEKLNK